jgi:hypothetical protein
MSMDPQHLRFGAVLALLSLVYGCTTPVATTCPVVTVEQRKPVVNRESMVPVLQRRIHEREKRIAELENQLDTLKHIELDVRTDKRMNATQ